MIIPISITIVALLMVELYNRTRFRIRWICPCGRPERRTIGWKWKSSRDYDSGAPSDAYISYRIGPLDDYAVRSETGRPRYDTCPRCGQQPGSAQRFATLLRGRPGKRIAKVTPHQIEDYLDWLQPPEPEPEPEESVALTVTKHGDGCRCPDCVRIPEVVRDKKKFDYGAPQARY